jgi:hypothetical protein
VHAGKAAQSSLASCRADDGMRASTHPLFALARLTDMVALHMVSTQPTSQACGFAFRKACEHTSWEKTICDLALRINPWSPVPSSR